MSIFALFGRHEDTMDSDDGGASDQHEAVTDDMNVGTIDVLWFPQLYWVFLCSVIAAFMLVNLLNKCLYRQRLRAALSADPTPAKPKYIHTNIYATLTAVTRELSNASLPSRSFAGLYWIQPTFGKFSLVALNFTVLMILDFYALSPSSYYDFEDTAYRAGFLSLGQVPLIFLLAGKNNIIGFLVGSSYERLNYLHRWVSRTLLLTTTLHMAYWFRSWAPYGQIGGQLRTDQTTQLGMSAWAVLLWIVFSSLSPVRGWRYEFFVIQHVISMVVFVTLIFLHTPASDHVWLWPAVAFYFFDRLGRAAYNVYANLAILHPKQRQSKNMSSVWGCQAQLTALPPNATRVTINNPSISWQAGQHAFLSIHSLIPFQSHPFTICSLPSDNKMEFIIRARNGATSKISSYSVDYLSSEPSDVEMASTTIKTVSASIEGPYGRMRQLQQFDSVVLIAGSTGATFTMPLLRSIVYEWKKSVDTNQMKAVTRHIRFVWIVKNKQQTTWFADQLNEVAQDVSRLRKLGMNVDVEMAVFATCDETLTSEAGEKATSNTSRGTAALLPFRDNSSTDEINASLSKKRSDKDSSEDGNLVEIKEVDSRLDSSSEPSIRKGILQSLPNANIDLKTCTPQTTCCCRMETDLHETSTSNSDVSCACNNSTIPGPQSTHSNSKPASTPTLPGSCTMHTGRPTPRSIILPVLERAQGESAVVACGPRGMNEEVRRCVVALSDERAVHKGSGALGIWFWGEGFGW